jgi:hypothetical protein
MYMTLVSWCFLLYRVLTPYTLFCVLLYCLQYCRIVQRTGFEDVKMKVSKQQGVATGATVGACSCGLQDIERQGCRLMVAGKTTLLC